jgi:hypothetical protein
MHWSVQYIGRPWERGEHDCWQLLRSVQEEQFGRTLPAYSVDLDDYRAIVRLLRDAPERQRWQLTETPEEGDSVLMGMGQDPSHVGVWVSANGGTVLHCPRNETSRLDSLLSLRQQGWSRIEFYRSCS